MNLAPNCQHSSDLEWITTIWIESQVHLKGRLLIKKYPCLNGKENASIKKSNLVSNKLLRHKLLETPCTHMIHYAIVSARERPMVGRSFKYIRY